jgi:hypothetical protein
MKKWGYLLALLIVLEVLNAAVYLSAANQPGFPLDDAWIHQTYARNLGLHGIMAFSPGEPSTGSTSPAWTVLLAAGYLLQVPFFSWAYIWGSIFAVATAYTAAHLSHDYFGDFKRAVIVAIICIIEWHLAWAALSGMEISLFIFLTLLTFLSLHRDAPPYLIGLLIGLTFLVRPEGIILGGIYGLKLLLTNRRYPRQMFKTIGTFVIVFLLVIGPWVIFNLNYSGRPFPNTISSKFMQYGYPWSIGNSLKYLLNVLIYFLEGPLMLLVPCAGFILYGAFHTRRTDLLYTLAWALILIGLYAVALPAIYHHGRYLMPLIPLITIFGVEGLCQLLEKSPHKSLFRPVIWVVLGGMVIVLWVNGASTFALQTKLLNESHLQAARWVDANTPKEAIIAAHDIGIIGYIAQRQIVDLAGLVTPEVIAIMNDQSQMTNFVRERQVTYVIVFSGYYREMLARLDAQLVFSPNMDNLRSLGLEPIEVYAIPAR